MFYFTDVNRANDSITRQLAVNGTFRAPSQSNASSAENTATFQLFAKMTPSVAPVQGTTSLVTANAHPRRPVLLKHNILILALNVLHAVAVTAIQMRLARSGNKQ